MSEPSGAVRRWVNDEELSRIEACLDDDIPESKVHARGDIAILVSSHRALHAQAVALAVYVNQSRINYWLSVFTYMENEQAAKRLTEESLHADEMYKLSQALLKGKP
jgi:hypothetical protein